MVVIRIEPNTKSLLLTLRERKQREIVDLGSGERPARERACRRRSPSFSLASYRSWFSSLPPWFSALSELWTASIVGVSGFWREDAVARVEGMVKKIAVVSFVSRRWRLRQLCRRRFQSPRGGSSFNFAVFGSSFREVKVPSTLRRRLRVSGFYVRFWVREMFSARKSRGFEDRCRMRSHQSDELSDIGSER